MAKSKAGNHRTILYTVLAIFCAVVFRQAGMHVDGLPDLWLMVGRSCIYIGLFAVWGISVRHRIIQPQVRCYLMAISALIVFWMIVRTIRFCLEGSIWSIRWLWYLYYLPMLAIPLLGVLIAFSLGKPDDYRLPNRTSLLYIPSIVLLLLVLTNDRHQLVFIFAGESDDYSYGLGYFLIFGWMMFCAAVALVTMMIKCRVPHSRTFLGLPFIPVTTLLIYAILYILRIPWLKHFAGDMTVVFCLLFVAILESCIACGLIQSNTGYEELFMVSSLGAEILNRENAVSLASADAVELTEEQRAGAEKQPILTGNHMLVRSQPISFGHILWQTDVTGIMEAIEQIEENNADLAERNRIRQENLEAQKKILSLQERNRVTDLLHRETAGQIDRIDRMLAGYEACADDRERRRLLAGAAVLGAYIKRYGNLLLVSEYTASADIRDLSRCFDESFMNLELLGVRCLHTLPSGMTLVTGDLLRVYRGFETTVEACLYDLRFVWIHMREGEMDSVLVMEFVCDTDLSDCATGADDFSYEDETCRFVYRMRKDRTEEKSMGTHCRFAYEGQKGRAADENKEDNPTARK